MLKQRLNVLQCEWKLQVIQTQEVRDSYNQELSDARANAVSTYLASVGVDAARLDAKGYGETQPIASNKNPDGRAQNRRIEFNVIK